MSTPPQNIKKCSEKYCLGQQNFESINIVTWCKALTEFHSTELFCPIGENGIEIIPVLQKGLQLSVSA